MVAPEQEEIPEVAKMSAQGEASLSLHGLRLNLSKCGTLIMPRCRKS